MSPSSFRSVLSLLAILGAALAAGGCSISSQKDSSIPWNRPADWEGQIPGMGTNTH